MLQLAAPCHVEPDMNTTSGALWVCADVVSLIHRGARSLFTYTFFSLLNFFWLSISLFLAFFYLSGPPAHSPSLRSSAPLLSFAKVFVSLLKKIFN